LILDLEDSVGPDAKEEARARVAEAVRGGGYGRREIVIRVNGMDTPWGEADLAAALAAGPDAVLVPKIAGPEDVAALNRRFADAGASPDTTLWVMMETPLAILSAQAIAAVAAAPGSRLEAFVMGTNDLAKEMSLTQTQERLPLVTALGICVLAARAYGVCLIDGVYNDIKNEAGFRDSARQGVEFGFDGKTVIHPSQVGPCNEIFSPPPEEIAAAREIIAAFEEPENKGKGVISLNGRMVELLHAEIAKRTVAIADAIAAAEG
jgi:citrate lyase subunit beta/citryl-CoA lyase